MKGRKGGYEAKLALAAVSSFELCVAADQRNSPTGCLYHVVMLKMRHVMFGHSIPKAFGLRNSYMMVYKTINLQKNSLGFLSGSNVSMNCSSGASLVVFLLSSSHT